MTWILVFGLTLASIVTAKTLGRGHAGRGLQSIWWLGFWTGVVWTYAIMSWWYGNVPGDAATTGGQ